MELCSLEVYIRILLSGGWIKIIKDMFYEENMKINIFGIEIVLSITRNWKTRLIQKAKVEAEKEGMDVSVYDGFFINKINRIRAVKRVWHGFPANQNEYINYENGYPSLSSAKKFVEEYWLD
jgi:hypothetical protein